MAPRAITASGFLILYNRVIFLTIFTQRGLTVPRIKECLMTQKVFDCFTFFNELELLELRLRELNSVVDYFVIVESTLTFQGEEKELFFLKNKHRFEDYMDKIVHIVVDDMPTDGEKIWAREHFQRSAIKRAFNLPQGRDIIIISDADEIPSVQAIEKMRESGSFFQLDMPMFQYYMNFMAHEEGWNKAFAFTFDVVDLIPDFNEVRVKQEETIKIFQEKGIILKKSGWHFTYLGGPERIRQKLNAFSHTGGWWSEMLADGGIENQLAIGYTVGNQEHFARYCEIDESFPRVLRERLDYFEKNGFVKNPYDALRDMQNIIKLFSKELERKEMIRNELVEGVSHLSEILTRSKS